MKTFATSAYDYSYSQDYLRIASAMVLKLYGLAMATCTKRVRCVLEELQVPYELINVNIFKGENKDLSFKARQPFGQIPYIDDDGFELFESRAICRYLALKHGVGKLIPDPNDLKKTALFEQAASIETSNFDHGASGLAHEKNFKKQVVLRSGMKRQR